MTSTASPSRIRFPGISPVAFEHPLDRTALEALRKAPGLDKLFKKLASLHFERIVRLHFTADSLRLSPRQRPRIFTLMREAAAVLDMEEPELYLLQSPNANAFAIGMERHTLVLTSGLVDLLSEEELRTVIAHELGHIKSGHMLYRTIAIFLSLIGLIAARNLPMVNLLSQALLYAFYDWSRKSELTADRAGLLVAQDTDVAVRTLLKLAGGPEHPGDSLSVEEFLKQAEDYEDMDESLLNVFYKLELTLEQTHPFPALRARELQRWAQSEQYQLIMRGEYPRTTPGAGERRCPRCAFIVLNPHFRFCPECGAELA
jgi:Zn-dependent protease with chaperone function